jgi:hypothetical protein
MRVKIPVDSRGDIYMIELNHITYGPDVSLT